MIISCALSIILVSAQALAGDPVLDTCNVIKDIDINPHTPGLGHMPASSIDEGAAYGSTGGGGAAAAVAGGAAGWARVSWGGGLECGRI